MEEFIQKILFLDKKTKELVDASEDELAKKKQETLDYLNTFELKGHEATKKIAQESYERVYQQAKDEVDQIQENNKQLLKAVDDFYNANKERLVEEAFTLLGLEKEE